VSRVYTHTHVCVCVYVCMYVRIYLSIYTHSLSLSHTHERPGEAVGGRHSVARVEGEEAQGEVKHGILFQVRAVFNHLFMGLWV
jgi:hypothetical protein